MLDRHEQPENGDGDVRAAGHGLRDVGGDRGRDRDERRARCGLRRGVRGVVRRGRRGDADALRPGGVGRSLHGVRRLRRADEPREVRDGLDRRRRAFARSARGEQDGEGIDRRQPAGIPCGDTCGVLLPIGTRTTLQAIPEAGLGLRRLVRILPRRRAGVRGSCPRRGVRRGRRSWRRGHSSPWR